MITIIKSIFAFIAFCCKIVYHIFKWLRIRLLVLYLIVCAILQLTLHVFDGKTYLFWIGVAVCLAVTLFAWGLFLKRKFSGKRVPREMPQKDTQEENAEPQAQKKEETPQRKPLSIKKNVKERPKYYDVAGRPDYVFAEYADRFELYFKDADGLRLVRTDYKEKLS